MNKLAKRYKAADKYLFDRLPDWKKATVNECRKLNETSRILDEFIQEVAKLAESESDIPFDVKSKSFSLDKKKKCGKI